MKKDFVNFVGAVADLIEMWDFNKPKPPSDKNIWLKKAKKNRFSRYKSIRKIEK